MFDREKNRLVWAHEGCASKVLEAFFEGLTADARAAVEVVSGDNARAIDECIAKYAPQAKRSRR
ncbi:transposase [Sutterella faecalis]|uniref:Transposase n=2 Tax=Sutterella TaxID=40544 RepID=A0AAI9SB15_9BURK|nr:transposase [Sutterella seckii]QDA55662.1 transposase [Sutterella faecalis]